MAIIPVSPPCLGVWSACPLAGAFADLPLLAVIVCAHLEATKGHISTNDPHTRHCSDDGTVKLWDSQDPSLGRCLLTLRASSAVRACGWSPGAITAAGVDSRLTSFWLSPQKVEACWCEY